MKLCIDTGFVNVEAWSALACTGAYKHAKCGKIERRTKAKDEQEKQD